jgi:endonuclease/exonuclease/phosphatase family metal-dependent hydrolase
MTSDQPIPEMDPSSENEKPGGPNPSGPANFSVGSFNMHAGVDGWGRPYDVIEACQAIDTDILILQECWTQDDPNNSKVGLAADIADHLGYPFVKQVELAKGRRSVPFPRATKKWMRPFDWRGTSHALYLDSNRPVPKRIAKSERYLSASPGSWGLSVLSRLPIKDHGEIQLGRLPKDRVKRVAIVVSFELSFQEVSTSVPTTRLETVYVVGVHMSHLAYGSPIHYLRLRRRLKDVLRTTPAVVGGDMNLWGPPAQLLLGRRGSVKGKTWPAWRPHSQVDHLLMQGPLLVLSGEVLEMSGSDHRPVRASFSLASTR